MHTFKCSWHFLTTVGSYLSVSPWNTWSCKELESICISKGLNLFCSSRCKEAFCEEEVVEQQRLNRLALKIRIVGDNCLTSREVNWSERYIITLSRHWDKLIFREGVLFAKWRETNSQIWGEMSWGKHLPDDYCKKKINLMQSKIIF